MNQFNAKPSKISTAIHSGQHHNTTDWFQIQSQTKNLTLRTKLIFLSLQKATQTHTESYQSREIQKNKQISDPQHSSIRGSKASRQHSIPLFKLNVTTETQATDKRKNKTMGISGTETVLQKGFLTELRNTSHLLLTKILILFNSKPTYGTGQVYKFVSEVFTMDHAS